MNARSLKFDWTITFSLDWALAVNRLAECINNTADHTLTGRNFENAASGTTLVIFFDCSDVTQEYGADLFFLKVLSQTINDLATLAGELQEFALHSTLKAIDTSNTVANLYNRTDFARFNAGIKGIKLLAQCFVDRLCGDFSH